MVDDVVADEADDDEFNEPNSNLSGGDGTGKPVDFDKAYKNLVQ